jgi:hypothetical protein
MRVSGPFALGVLLIAALIAAPPAPIAGASAAIPAQSYPTQWWVNGNGTTGTLEYDVDFGNQVNGSLFGDSVAGFLQGRRLVLFREGRNEQVWEGWIMDPRGPNRRDSGFSEDLIIAGTYTDGADTYPWYGMEWGSGSAGRGAPVVPVSEPPQGFFDGASCQGIGGWVRFPDDPNAAAVRVYADGPAGRGRDLGTVVADQMRSDLPFRDRNHGFSIAIPETLLDGRSHAIYVYAIDSRSGEETLLDGSPKSIRCGGGPGPNR